MNYWQLFFVISVVLLFILRLYLSNKRKTTTTKLNAITIGFFHPFCNGGGGGERVLWRALQELFAESDRRKKPVHCVVYTGDKVSSKDILNLAKNRFGIDLFGEQHRLEFVFLKSRVLVEASTYPRFTMIGQSIGSMFLALEAAFRFTPQLYFDTMGFAFTFPIFAWFASSCVLCYVHYPTISTDMLSAIDERRASVVHNDTTITKSRLLTKAKLIYYKIFAYLYGFVGSRATIVMTNSSWTGAHIREIWGEQVQSCVVYPPCDTTQLSMLPMQPRARTIVSIAQFRPEKDHSRQLKAFAKLRQNKQFEAVQLVLIGGVRNDEDRARVAALRQQAKELGVVDNVKFVENASLDDLHRYLRQATVGLHTMWNEHFGIGVVEMMAAGVIVVAHNSGGPKEDIVRPYMNKQTGYLASSVDQYAIALAQALSLTSEQQKTMQLAAREAVKQFSDESFAKQFSNAINTTVFEQKP